MAVFNLLPKCNKGRHNKKCTRDFNSKTESFFSFTQNVLMFSVCLFFTVDPLQQKTSIVDCGKSQTKLNSFLWCNMGEVIISRRTCERTLKSPEFMPSFIRSRLESLPAKSGLQALCSQPWATHCKEERQMSYGLCMFFSALHFTGNELTIDNLYLTLFLTYICKATQG